MQKAIDDSIQESDEELSRDDFFLSSKLWNNFHSKEMVQTAITSILKNLGIDYLDLLYIHWPMALQETCIQDPFPKDEQGNLIFSEINFKETFKEMEKSLDISNIGLCNFNIVILLFLKKIIFSIIVKNKEIFFKNQLSEVVDTCEIKPTVHQIEVNPYFNNQKLVKFSQSNE